MSTVSSKSLLMSVTAADQVGSITSTHGDSHLVDSRDLTLDIYPHGYEEVIQGDHHYGSL